MVKEARWASPAPGRASEPDPHSYLPHAKAHCHSACALRIRARLQEAKDTLREPGPMLQWKNTGVFALCSLSLCSGSFFLRAHLPCFVANSYFSLKMQPGIGSCSSGANHGPSSSPKQLGAPSLQGKKGLYTQKHIKGKLALTLTRELPSLALFTLSSP